LWKMLNHDILSLTIYKGKGVRQMTGTRPTIFGLTNMKRCFFAALVSVLFFPVIVLFSCIEPEAMEFYKIPAAFFSITSGAFAFLIYQLIQNKNRSYYTAVQFLYLTFFLIAMSYMAEESLVFYYAAVLVAGLTVYLNLSQYLLLMCEELFFYALIMIKSGVTELPLFQMLVLSGVHLLMFVFSRDAYATKRKLLIEEKKLRKKMQEAERDPLTGLMNRRGLERRSKELLYAYARNKDMVAVFVMDIDLFKSYNDRFGHVQGDQCIKKIAQCIEQSVAEYGIAARIGGEEFLVFVQGDSVEEVHNLAEQVRSNVERLRIARGSAGEGVVTISVGVDVRYVTEDTTLESLYGRADRQLYQAKQEGRNRVRSTQMSRIRNYKIV